MLHGKVYNKCLKYKLEGGCHCLNKCQTYHPGFHLPSHHDYNC